MASNTMAAGLVTGSHARNEHHVIHGMDEERQRPPATRESGNKTRICRVCGDEIGLKETGDVFVACYECGFPVCRPCYEYERSDGDQCCPQCHTRYKRHKGCPRVEGDDEDNFDDDFEDEFQLRNHHDTTPDPQQYWENGHQHLHTNGAAHHSVAGSVVGGKEGAEEDDQRETYSTSEWKERVEKWKTRQEKRGLVTKLDDGGNDPGDEDDFL